jgi:hypothetical protein
LCNGIATAVLFASFLRDLMSLWLVDPFDDAHIVVKDAFVFLGEESKRSDVILRGRN